MKGETKIQRLVNFIKEPLNKLQYFFAKKWLDKTFGEDIGKQEYWGDFIQSLIVKQKLYSPKHISIFKKGSIITRVSKTPTFGDRSYMGDKMKLLNYEKNQILLKIGKEKIVLIDDEWGWGWEEYIDI